MNFKNISQTKIIQAVKNINLRPQKLFTWQSPQYKFSLEYSKIHSVNNCYKVNKTNIDIEFSTWEKHER